MQNWRKKYFGSSVALTSFLLFCAIFVLIKFGLVDMLPAKLSADSQKIVDPGVVDYELTGSFAATALFFASLPPLLLDAFVSSIAMVTFYLFLKDVRRVGAVIAIGSLLLPMTLLCLLWPAKETVVVVLSILVMVIYEGRSSHFKKALFVFCLYLAYAALFRSYFALIAVIYLGFLVFRRFGKAGLMAMFLIAVFLLFLAPAEFFDAAQGQRDRANDYAVYVDSDNRTAFYNLLPPVSAPAFFVNYLYALFVLIFPVFVFGGIVDLVPTVLFFFLAPRVARGWRSKDSRSYGLSALFIAHWIVLIMFEPDVGSYLRHISSAFLYLSPVFGLGLLSSRWRAVR